MLSLATRAFAEPAGLPALLDLADACFAVALAAWLLAVAFAISHRAADLRARGGRSRLSRQPPRLPPGRRHRIT
jgi:hypothetical protein